MKLPSLLAILLIAFLLIQPTSAYCQYMKGKDGYPSGMIPDIQNITINFPTPTQQNRSFILFMKAEAGTKVWINCKVELSVENESNALRVEFSNYSFETGAAIKRVPITVILTPINLVNFPPEIRTYIKIKDIDNRDNYALIPIIAKFQFAANRVIPTPTPIPGIATQGPGNTGTPIPGQPTATPGNTIKGNGTGFSNIITIVEDSTSKYLIAVMAFLFLAGILWLGFNSLQRD
jgi:hypothetical protein